MSLNTTFRITAFILAAGLLTSCVATKSYKKPDTGVETEELYPYEKVQMDSTTLADMPWDQVFEDPQLRALIDEALQNNVNLQQAVEQIRVAEARYYRDQMGMFPSLNIGGSASYNEPSDNNVNFGSGFNNVSIPASESYAALLSSTWEMDVWGKLNSARKASLANLLQTEATRRAVQTTLIANVATAYYRLLALDRQLEIVRETVENRKKDVKTVKSLHEGAVVSKVSVQQSIANRYAAEVTIPELKQQITEQENALSVLLGREPGEIERTSLERQDPIDSLATGVPGQLLKNRPDVIAAEYNFRSAFELTNQARTYFYPSFTLTAEGGFRSLETGDLFMPGSIFYNLIGGLTQPVFSQGRNKARLEQSKARQQQVLLNLKQTTLEAGREVSNALSQYQNASRQLRLNRQQLEALQKAVDYSRELLQYGEATYAEVLTAQQNYLSVQIGHVNDRLQQLTAEVNLYRALGGGWSPEADSTSALDR